MLDQIRNLIARYNFPPELVGKIECLCCDVYDLARNGIVREKRRGLNSFSQRVKELEIGQTVFVPYDDYVGRKFHAYAHNLCILHSKIQIRQDTIREGWVVQKIK